MKDKIAAILGYKVPKDLEWVVSRMVVAGNSIEEIVEKIDMLNTNR